MVKIMVSCRFSLNPMTGKLNDVRIFGEMMCVYLDIYDI